jgi:L-threonylcarbamoyladenylate synthase
METPVTGYLDRYNVRRVASVLSSGGIAVLPTDTVYGFHCLTSRPAAVEKIRALKGRGEGAGFILLASDIGMVDGMVSGWPVESRELLSSLWPAVLTAILPSSPAIPSILSPLGKIAIRVPDSGELRSVIRSVRQPVVSTSVNAAGCKPMTRISDIRKTFPALDAYISKRGRPASLPSTIVDFTAYPPELIRFGRYPWLG